MLRTDVQDLATVKAGMSGGALVITLAPSSAQPLAVTLHGTSNHVGEVGTDISAAVTELLTLLRAHGILSRGQGEARV